MQQSKTQNKVFGKNALKRNSELYNSTAEKDILLSLNKDIAAVRDKKDVLTLIYPKIRQLFQVEDVFICSLDFANDVLIPILRVGSARRTTHKDYKQIVNSKFPLHDAFYGSILSSKEPVIFNLPAICSLPNPPFYLKLAVSMGLSESLSVTLYSAGEPVGIISVWSEKPDFFTARHRKLIADIADCMSIVVVNILSAEAIQKRDRENEILLSLNSEIARIRDKDGMLHFIRFSIRKYIDFNDGFILRYNKKTKTAKPYIFFAENSHSPRTEFENQIDIEYNVYNDDLTMLYSPIVQDVAVLAAAGRKEVEFIRSAGMVEFVTVKLIEGTELMGILALLTERRSSFTPDDLTLLERIANQVAIATANIIANEEIANREREKSILLALSNEIASPGNRDEFFKIVTQRIKRILAVDSFAISQISEDCKTYQAFNLEDQFRPKDPELYDKLIGDTYSVSDCVYSEIMQSETPVLFKVNELALRPNIPAYVEIWKLAGVQEAVCVALRAAGKFVGTAHFYSLGKSPIDLKSDLLQAICAQLAIKVANIKAYEEIEEREKEKSILLSISNEIAGLKNRDDLFDVVLTQLKKIFTFDRFIITYLHDDGETYGVFRLDQKYNIDISELFRNPDGEKLRIADNPVYNRAVDSDEPLLTDVDEFPITDDKFSLSGLYRTYSVKQALQVPLRVGGKTIGCASFHYFSKAKINIKNSLLKGVCAQLGVAVSNILANEKVLNQLAEINKYKLQLENERTYLKEEIENSNNYTEIIGESPEIKKVFRLVTQVAYSDSTVLILGETGTGKELIARAIHNSSTRKNKLMIKVNCAALPANLIESELFGHEKGSFTGAIDKRTGKFELANNGTLFLDEIGEMTADVQAKLLRALQEKEIERVGGKTTIKVDVRIIAATNRDLEKLMDEGKFRSDLYYRLNVFPITIPPLRDRREDIPQLASYFILHYAKKAGKKINTISNRALEELTKYDWPGNIRELEHLIERSVLLASTDTIQDIHLPRRKKHTDSDSGHGEIAIKTINENEKEHILKTLKYTKGRIGGAGGAAELLGLPTSTLNSRIKKLGIRREHFG